MDDCCSSGDQCPCRRCRAIQAHGLAPTIDRALDAIIRRRRAIQLLDEGLSYAVVATRVGYLRRHVIRIAKTSEAA